MASIRTIAHAHLATRVPIANTKSTNAILAHAKMVELVRITTMITPAIVLMDLREKIVPNTWIGVYRIHARMVHHVVNVRTLTNVIVYRDGRENCATSKWFHAKMLLFAKV